MHDWLGVSTCLEVLAWTETELSDPVRSDRLSGAAQKMYDKGGSSPLFGSADLARTDRQYTGRATAALGAAKFEEERRTAQQLSNEELFEYVLRRKLPTTAEPPGPPPPVKLTPREREVSRLVAEGLSNKEIGE